MNSVVFTHAYPKRKSGERTEVAVAAEKARAAAGHRLAILGARSGRATESARRNPVGTAAPAIEFVGGSTGAGASRIVVSRFCPTAPDAVVLVPLNCIR